MIQMNSEQTIFVTKRNKKKLEELLGKIEGTNCIESGVDLLTQKLKEAEVVGSESIPRNCVTMGSQVSIIDIKTSERQKFFLVYPDQADYQEGKLSVLSPLGACLFGHQVGDEPIWEEITETGHFIIAKVDSQPEAKSTYTI